MKFAYCLVATLFGCATAVDLVLFDNWYECVGEGITCLDIPEDVCCVGDDDFYGSGSAGSPNNPGDAAAIFYGQPTNPCADQISSFQQIPVCIPSGESWGVGGMAFKSAGEYRVKRAGAAMPTVRGSPFFANGTARLVVSREKMDREGLKMPAKGGYEAFAKKYADRVISLEQ